MTTADVIVIGSGLAGLTAGATAARSGCSVLVLEKGHVGGRGRSATREGFTFNLGGHALYQGGPGEAVRRRLGVPARGKLPPTNRFKLWIDGRLHPMPAGPTSLLTTSAISARGKAQLATVLGFIGRVDAAKLSGTTVDDWIAGNDLKADAEAVLRVLMRTATYGADFATMSADAAVTQLQLAVAHNVVYLHGGWSQMVDGLRAQVDVRTASVQAVHGDASGVEVHTADGVLTARAAVVAAGSPDATRRLLSDHPGWGGLGPANESACLDVGTRGAPSPGYVLGVDQPVFATTAAPPARLAPPGTAAVAVIRYAAHEPKADRALLETFLSRAGVRDDDVIVKRFLPRLSVSSTIPRADLGGLVGRPSVTATGMDSVFMAGDWVGPEGYLADAVFASGEAAGRAAVRIAERAATMVR